MHSWVVDDKTSHVECAFKNPDESVSLTRPQIIAVMDSTSRKFVGWTVSAKAPNPTALKIRQGADPEPISSPL